MAITVSESAVSVVAEPNRGSRNRQRNAVSRRLISLLQIVRYRCRGRRAARAGAGPRDARLPPPARAAAPSEPIDDLGHEGTDPLRPVAPDAGETTSSAGATAAP